MNFTIGTLLALSFLISVLGLFLFLWAQMNGLMRAGRANAEISTRELERDCALGPAERHWFDAALERLGLSARAYHRTLRVARTIVDLDGGAGLLDRTHLAEALMYRRF